MKLKDVKLTSYSEFVKAYWLSKDAQKIEQKYWNRNIIKCNTTKE